MNLIKHKWFIGALGLLMALVATSASAAAPQVNGTTVAYMYLYVGESTAFATANRIDLWPKFTLDGATGSCTSSCTYSASLVGGDSIVTVDPDANLGLGNGWFHALDAAAASTYSAPGLEAFDVYATRKSDGVVSSNALRVYVYVNAPPTISSISDKTTNEDTSITGINFSVDEGTGSGFSSSYENNQTLSITATSNNTTLIPNSGLNVTYSEGAGIDASLLAPFLNVTPAANEYGTATITVTVRDNGAAH